MDNITPGRELGRGSFGQVFEATDNATGEIIAVKICELQQCTESQRASIEKEVCNNKKFLF